MSVRVWIPTLLAAGVGIGFYLWYEVQPPPVHQPETRYVVEEPKAPSPSPPPSERPTPKAPEAPQAALPDPEAKAPEAQPDAEVTGPYTIPLGEHRIYLKDGDHILHVGVQITVDTQDAKRETWAKRRTLVRMLFFLGTHRSAEGLLSDDGKSRFAADLHERFSNAIRSGEVLQVEINPYEVEPRPPDAPKDPEAP